MFSKNKVNKHNLWCNWISKKYFQILDSIWKKEVGMTASAFSIRYWMGVAIQVTNVLATTPMDSGYWWVNKASKAVKEQRPAVNKMKNGNSFFGYTDTSWKEGNSSRSAHSVQLKKKNYFLFSSHESTNRVKRQNLDYVVWIR